MVSAELQRKPAVLPAFEMRLWTHDANACVADAHIADTTTALPVSVTIARSSPRVWAAVYSVLFRSGGKGLTAGHSQLAVACIFCS